MEHKLCWRCREAWGKVFHYYPSPYNLMGLVHCHHDEPEEKPSNSNELLVKLARRIEEEADRFSDYDEMEFQKKMIYLGLSQIIKDILPEGRY